MLINFKVSNLYSFNEEVELSMIASKTTQHSDHVLDSHDRYKPKVLKASIIYGANSSGKSNLVKALQFVRRLVVVGTKSDSIIPRRHFKLIKEGVDKPSRVEIKFMHDGKIYIYGFIFNSEWILEEWLKEAGKTVEKTIYSRKTVSVSHKYGKTIVDAKLRFSSQKEKQFIEFVAEGTRPNQLFLTESRKRNVTQLFSPYEWFKDVLTIIFPDTSLSSIEMIIKTDKELSKLFEHYFHAFDTGINGIETKEMDIDSALPDLPDEIKDELHNDLKPNGKTCAIVGDEEQKYSIYKNIDNELKALKLYTKHKLAHSNENVYFEINEESDGVRRLMDLVPMLHTPTKTNRVFVIDEINRSLHPQITYKLIDLFLHQKIGENGQLIATTHEVTLLSQDLFRKDEIWFMSKGKNGGSRLFSLDKFAPRFDKDIFKEYMKGKYGGIPNLHSDENNGM